MRIAVFSAKDYDHTFLNQANQVFGFVLNYFESALSTQTVALAQGYEVVCAFVHDEIDADVLKRLAAAGVRLVALRCAGFNNVDIDAALHHKITIARVPAYSPHSVAEHALGMILCLNRKFHRAWNRVREGNFSLQGLLGFDLRGKTVGIIGTGRIGTVLAKLMTGLECRVIAFDPRHNQDCVNLGVEYTTIEQLYRDSDIVSLHCPLTCDTHHLIDAEAIRAMKDGVMLINTSRGAVVDTQAVIDGLKTSKLGALGLDVYEQEDNLFFRDLSDEIIQDDVFERLLTFPNVLITAHQGFFTAEALTNIAQTTLANIAAWPDNIPAQNLVTANNIVNEPCVR